MEAQNIINLLNNTENESSKFATKKWYIIDSEPKGNYSHENPIKFLTSSLESSPCDYSDAYILVTGDHHKQEQVTQQMTSLLKLQKLHLIFDEPDKTAYSKL